MRRLFNIIFATLVVCIGVTPMWASGTLHVSGDVSGIWPAGQEVSVDGPIFVAPTKGLYIEPGVRILFKTNAAIVVRGSLEVQGTADAPVVFEPLEGWQGIFFEANGTDIRRLHFMTINTSSGIPADVVTGQDSHLEIADCDFTAHYSCIVVTGGRIWADRNSILTDYEFSHAVEIKYLLNDIHDPCAGGQINGGNRVADNIIKVMAPWENLIFRDRFAIGLSVDGSTRTCFRGNVISVTSPGCVVGCYFGLPDSSYDIWSLEYCVVTVRGMGAPYAYGVENSHGGHLNVLRCSIDVGAPLPGWRPVGVFASGDANIRVNSCLVQIDRDTAYFVTYAGGAMDVDYSNEWVTMGGNNAPADPHHVEPDVIKDVATDNIVYGDHMYNQDPHLRLAGEWGAWQSLEEAHAYYGLLSPSPCIDHGDITLAGWDPDNTLPDIGRYYFPQSPSSGVNPPSPAVAPESVLLAPIYPNPFNSTAIIPFTLNRSGSVRMVVHDLLGREVSVLVSGPLSAGDYRVPFSGSDLPSGTYVVSLDFDGSPVASQPMMLLK